MNRKCLYEEIYGNDELSFDEALHILENITQRGRHQRQPQQVASKTVTRLYPPPASIIALPDAIVTFESKGDITITLDQIEKVSSCADDENCNARVSSKSQLKKTPPISSSQKIQNPKLEDGPIIPKAQPMRENCVCSEGLDSFPKRDRCHWTQPQRYLEIEVEPGVSLPLITTLETRRALEENPGLVEEVWCLGCGLELLCISGVTCVICPQCLFTSPVNDFLAYSGDVLSLNGGSVATGLQARYK